MQLPKLASLVLATCASRGLVDAAAANGTHKIDVHAHYLPDFYRQALVDAGHVPGPDGMPAIPVSADAPPPTRGAAGKKSIHGSE